MRYAQLVVGPAGSGKVRMIIIFNALQSDDNATLEP